MSHLNGFVTCEASQRVDVSISGREHNWKLKFSLQTHLTHINTIFKYCHASVNLDNVHVLCLEDENVYRPVLKNKTAAMSYVFLKKNSI